MRCIVEIKSVSHEKIYQAQAVNLRPYLGLYEACAGLDIRMELRNDGFYAVERNGGVWQETKLRLEGFEYSEHRTIAKFSHGYEFDFCPGSDFPHALRVPGYDLPFKRR